MKWMLGIVVIVLGVVVVWQWGRAVRCEDQLVEVLQSIAQFTVAR